MSRLAGRFVEDPEKVVDRAEGAFEAMLPDMAYLDKPEHPLAAALFTCSVNLSLYLVLKEHGVNAHEFGASMLRGLARAPVVPPPMNEEHARAFIATAITSQREALPGEDVYEAFEGDGANFDFGINVTSCAICHEFGKHEAMELMPYMCAVDDVMSNKGDQGLRRTGSIGVGADHCDFRYKHGRKPLRLAAQYPDQIRGMDDQEGT